MRVSQCESPAEFLENMLPIIRNRASEWNSLGPAPRAAAQTSALLSGEGAPAVKVVFSAKSALAGKAAGDRAGAGGSRLNGRSDGSTRRPD
jgi:hypothetical protein